MLVLAGAPAFTEARLGKRLARIRVDNPGVTAASATFVHFVDVDGALAPDDARLLDRLLVYGPRTAARELPGALVRVVVPRLGTISPWSSKATDIARISGLRQIRRLERGVRWAIAGEVRDAAALAHALADRMTESVLASEQEGAKLFEHAPPRPLETIALGSDPRAAIAAADRKLGLALSPDEIDYLATAYASLGRDPTDVELYMFAQANSEHCRHKIFNATFVLDGAPQAKSLFQLIKRSTEASPEGVLSAYKDNAAVVRGPVGGRFFADVATGEYAFVREPVHMLMKVETHNHPTAISPYPGAATGSGGEIRDEGATGRGARPKAGLCGFTVSNLRLPGAVQPWEVDHGKPGRIVSALDIMIEGPIGAAAFNNEFGRPNLTGYFRTFELDVPAPGGGTEVRGYHKPIMIAGGLGNVREAHVLKGEIPPGAPVIVLGGPAMLIGLGGGAASSVASGSQAEDLDFASVQRDNAEIQRRCQEVIDRCWALGDANPIVSVHDVGAGGLSNALPELVHESKRGAKFELRKVPSDEPGMTPLEIWCNEAQERYVLALAPDRLDDFTAIARRERCPFAVLGTATAEGQLEVSDAHFSGKPIDLPLEVLLGKPPKMTRQAEKRPVEFPPLAIDASVGEALERVLRLPTVADKGFLISIGDRTVGGLCSRDQLVGPWQVPVADCAVTTTTLDSYTGEAMAMGERSPVALLDAAASVRLAIGEVITNLAGAPIAKLGDIKLSANWMAAAGHPGEDAKLYEAVRAAGSELAPALGIAIPVGKDSMSMRTVWNVGEEKKAVIAPLSLIASGFAQVTDVRRVLTPELTLDGDTTLLLLDLGGGKNRLGGSALAQVHGQVGQVPADLDDPALLRGFFAAVQSLAAQGVLLAYHDRSDGGLIVTALEMAFASGCGLDLAVPDGVDPLAFLFNEELGAVVQVRTKDVASVENAFTAAGVASAVRVLGKPTAGNRVVVGTLFAGERSRLRAIWGETSHRIAALRDDATCADEEQAARADASDPGRSAKLSFDPADDVAAPFVARGVRPRVAILREQGVNGHIEMAAAFTRAGFTAVDVHMTDLIEGRRDLTDMVGLAACGGFSFGDVLGAGEGWAKSALFNARARKSLEGFFARSGTFGLGVCNGCQMFSALKEIIPGAAGWPRFVRNRSEQFEARLPLVEIVDSPSIFFRGMAGTRAPIAVAHGEGRVEVTSDEQLDQLVVAARFVDHQGQPTMSYPANPNGSPRGITAVTTADGRFMAIMPHPERVYRTVQLSWHPAGWGEDSPWMRMFRNARVFVG